MVALYKQTDLLGNIQEKQKSSLVDEFSKARAAILKLINDARVFSIRKRNPEYDDIKLVNFNISRNTSRVSPIAQVDPDSRLLKLPTILKRRTHLSNRGARRTGVTVEVVGGQTGQLGKQFPPIRSVDSKPETFWADTVYSDVPVQTIYNRWGPNQNGEITEFINGPYAVLKLSFSSAEVINQIKILPFSNHPIKVIEASYRPNSSSKVRYQVPNFRVEESLDWIEYNFDTVFATDIEIVLAQENFRTIVVKVPKSVLYATDFLIKLQEERAAELAEIPNLNNVALGGNHELYTQAVEDLAAVMSSKELEKNAITEIDLVGKTVLSIGESLSVFNPSLSSLVHEVSNYTESLPKEAKDDIQTFNKYEYIIGAREVETNYIVYSPVAYYESEKFEPASTVANVELEVDERHPVFKSQYGDFTKTSTEWEIELAEDRKVPIFPANFEEDGLLKVVGERLQVNQFIAVGYSRFKSFLSYVLVRENDKILAAGTEYSVTWNADYNGRLQIMINPASFDFNKIYTIDYYADPSAKSIDVLSLFSDKSLAQPDVFQGTTANNQVKLSSFPFVNYAIVNSEDFVYSDSYNGYQYIPPTGAYTTGIINIKPTWVKSDGSVIDTITGSVTGLALEGYGTNWNTLSATYLDDPYRYYLKITNAPGAIFEINSLVNSGTLLFTEVPKLYTGLIGNEIPGSNFSGNFNGVPPSGMIQVPYSIEVVYQAGDQIFGFDNIVYEPINVTVGGIKARNITSYQDLEQPAFNVANSSDGEYEYIHDGRSLYFNRNINGAEIQVDYRWMTKYAKVNCVLRANKLVSPTVSPVVNEYRLLLNTTIL
jgi:hypothetical protein